MKIIVALGFANGVPCPHAGQYLKSFDFEAGNGVGFGVFTSDKSKAMTFHSAVEAFEFWKTVSKTVPKRADGQPNRPLTALSITLEDL